MYKDTLQTCFKILHFIVLALQVLSFNITYVSYHKVILILNWDLLWAWINFPPPADESENNFLVSNSEHTYIILHSSFFFKWKGGFKVLSNCKRYWKSWQNNSIMDRLTTENSLVVTILACWHWKHHSVRWPQQQVPHWLARPCPCGHFNGDIPPGLLICNAAATLILQIEERTHTQRINVTRVNLQQWATNKFPKPDTAAITQGIFTFWHRVPRPTNNNFRSYGNH